MRRKDFNKRPIRASEKAVYLDKLSVITNAKQMRMVCRDFTNFVPEGTIFNLQSSKALWTTFVLGKKLDKIHQINKNVFFLSIICCQAIIPPLTNANVVRCNGLVSSADKCFPNKNWDDTIFGFKDNSDFVC